MARWGSPWPKYVPVAKRQQKAAQAIKALTKKGDMPSPVVLEGRTIATSFWGKAWCEHLESLSDFENRLPRGRSYVCNGSVVDLRVSPRRVDALVQGTSLYKVAIQVEGLDARRWRDLVRACAGRVDSIVELLQGRFDQAVMQIVGRAEGGLFPQASQISMSCSCPDWATMCKHVAAVLYGVGARLDQRPELLFTLREVDPTELVAGAPGALTTARGGAAARLDSGSLEDVFDIELDAGVRPEGAAKVTKAASPGRGAGANLARATASPAEAKRGAEPARAETTAQLRSSAAQGPPRAATEAPLKRRRAAGAVPRTITDAELAARGVPAGTTRFWAERGVLARTDRAGVYELSDEAERRLAAFSPPAARKANEASEATSSPPAPPQAKSKGATKRAAQAGRPSKANAGAAASGNGRAAKKTTREGRKKAVRSRAVPAA